ncbi:hypothetical protein CALVIDRAFT_532143 [Calocera viscosa TUFC12733]|uniref:Uncharacterized protein n=1 Tax=Calocera viscosa (strain TUFC12733) TaxID=1330018 RepID=A0A167FCK8_CALVF|nr:hypothetical protein CALVIDRAFT_532143 [Calocera viscosa TUFC12733]
MHIEPSDEDWSLWALALNKKVDGVTHDNPPLQIANKWSLCYNVRAPTGIVRSATRPQKSADVVHAAAQSVLQGLLPWGWPGGLPGNTIGSFPLPGAGPPVFQQASAPPAASILAPAGGQHISDLIDDSIVHPRLHSWLADIDRNPNRNPDDRNFSQYGEGLASSGLLRLHELAALEAAELVEIYNSAEPTPQPAKIPRGTAAILLGYAKKDVYQR